MGSGLSSKKKILVSVNQNSQLCVYQWFGFVSDIRSPYPKCSFNSLYPPILFPSTIICGNVLAVGNVSIISSLVKSVPKDLYSYGEVTIAPNLCQEFITGIIF